MYMCIINILSSQYELHVHVVTVHCLTLSHLKCTCVYTLMYMCIINILSSQYELHVHVHVVTVHCLTLTP